MWVMDTGNVKKILFDHRGNENRQYCSNKYTGFSPIADVMGIKLS